jgi:small subunit ribosomal protein S2
MPTKLPSLKEMVEAGVHFGHKKQRSNPRFKKYIFCLRDGVHIINLEKTEELLEEALEFLTQVAKSGKTILFVGTKKQVKKAVEEAAKKTGMPYVTERWLGGMLTNFETVRKSIKHLNNLEAKKTSEEYKGFTKHEKNKIDEEIEKLHKNFDGIIKMEKQPDALFIVDAEEEYNAVNEARKMKIPVAAICDTDTNPDKVNFPIPANDDAVKSVELMVNLIGDAVLDAKNSK